MWWFAAPGRMTRALGLSRRPAGRGAGAPRHYCKQGQENAFGAVESGPAPSTLPEVPGQLGVPQTRLRSLLVCRVSPCHRLSANRGTY